MDDVKRYYEANPSGEGFRARVYHYDYFLGKERLFTDYLSREHDRAEEALDDAADYLEEHEWGAELS
jgi:hypothetical protein